MPRWIERTFVWTGGALFATSLVLAIWRYGRDFGRLEARPTSTAVVIDTALLVAFAAHHSLFARPKLKALVGRLIPAQLIRSCYVWVASLLLIGVCTAWQPLGGTFYQASGWLKALLLVVQVVGLVLLVRAVRAISALELAGVEPPASKGELQMRGPYGLVRHPLYLGWILAVGAVSHMTGDRLLFFLLTTLYITVAIPWEEAGLVAEFGESYERYRTQVRWRVVPHVY